MAKSGLIIGGGLLKRRKQKGPNYIFLFCHLKLSLAAHAAQIVLAKFMEFVPAYAKVNSACEFYHTVHYNKWSFKTGKQGGLWLGMTVNYGC